MKEHSGIDILEEAVALVRHAPAKAWTWYLAGGVPMFGALLFYVQASTGALAVPDPAGASLFLAFLFAWRQLSRSMFGRVLAEELSGEAPAMASAAWARAAVRTWWGGWLRTLFFMLPAPYLTALFRNYQAYAWTEDDAFRRAAAMTTRGGNALIAWITLWAMSFFVWVNVLTGMAGAQALYRIFTGEENEWTRNIGVVFNRTVVLASVMIAWGLCDVVTEALYVLRRFYGESESTGADLLRTFRRATARAASLLLLTIALVTCAPAQTQGPPPATPRETGNLNRAIDQVLAERQYQWREAAASKAGSDSAVTVWIRNVAASLRRFLRSVTRPIGRMWDAFLRWLTQGGNSVPSNGPRAPVNGLRVASLLTTLLLAGALLALLIRTRRQSASAAFAGGTPASTAVDLNDPGLVATDLEEEQWVALARDWMAKGDPRMAIRAWFLASLAFLNRRQLVSINAYKSNRDYQRELARRSHSIRALDGEFAASVRHFENVWYGMYPLDVAGLERYAEGFERMRELCR